MASRLVGLVSCRHELAVERGLAISFSNQLRNSWRLHLTKARLRPTSLFMVTVEVFPSRPGHLQNFLVQVRADKVTNLLIWRSPEHGQYCELCWSSLKAVWRFYSNLKTMLSTVEFCGDYSSREVIVTACAYFLRISLAVIIPAKARDYVLPALVCLSVCLFVCLLPQ